MAGDGSEQQALAGPITSDGRVCLLAPDSFKGTIQSDQVAASLARGAAEAGFETIALPLADGGEGTAAVLRSVLGGEEVTARVSDPLGCEIDASFVLLADGTAVVEVAAASGLTLISDQERDAIAASTRGTGELIVSAIQAGAGAVMVAAGGSATTDGGSGAIEALREAGFDSDLHRLRVLCDARTSWEDSPRVFAPQKGASPDQVAELEERLDALADSMPQDPRGRDLTGAAGGLSGGLWSWFGAELVSGAETVLDLLDFDTNLEAATCVITGEGRLDASTAEGKLVAEVAGRARRASKRCFAVVGENALDGARSDALGLYAVREGGDPGSIAASARQLAELAL